MADKTPIRTVFNASNVATGLAEFQSGETVRARCDINADEPLNNDDVFSG